MTLLAFADRVQETAQNVGTASSVTLLGAAAGNLRTFADAGLTGKTVPYALQHRTSGQWEIGYGIYALGGLTRAVVFCNSDGTTALVNFSSGIVDVWNDLPAEKIVAQDADSNHVTLPGGITVNGPIVATGPITAPGGITGPVAWTSITGTPTTIAGYGITDAYTKSASDARFAPIAVPWLTITGTPTTLAGYGITDAYTKTASDARYAPVNGPFAWSSVTGTPTTLNGYGITDAYTKAQADAKFALTPTPWATITGTPTTLFGYGITDAYTKTTSDALYAFKGGPFAWSGVTGTPTTLAGYGITDAFTKTESDARYASSGAVYVNSITGTAGRITVTGPASAPIVNIDPAYVGQFSITTLGTITTGVWNGAVVATTFGGTGLAAYAAGDLLYASAANTLARRLIGTPNQFLAVAGGFPAWHTLVAADISDLATAGTGITVVGTITTGTWHGTPIEPAYGGTGLTSYAKGDLIYASAVNTLANLVVGGAAQVLTVTAGVPAWHTLVTADITDLATAATGITKVGTITTGTWAATPVAPINGGTGLTAYSLGDLIIGSGINTLARLAGPTAITHTFLMSAGTGSAAAAPIWATITAADIGAGTFSGAFTFSNTVTVSGTLTAATVHVTGPLTVDGAVTFNGGVTTTGNISGANITATPNFIVTGTAAQSRGIALQTGGSNRWYAFMSGPEGGSNAGGDFALNAYSDTATLIDVPISILRVAGGLMTVSRPVTITGNVTAPFFVANGGPPQSNGFVIETAGLPRWTFQGNGATEGGSNAGTNLIIGAYTDGGVLIDQPISIVRAAGGAITLSRPLETPTYIHTENFKAFRTYASSDVQGIQWTNNAQTLEWMRLFSTGLTIQGTLTTSGNISGASAGFTGQVNITEASGNNLLLISSTASVGPLARWQRTASVARVWQLRLDTTGAFQFVDETGGALVLTLTTAPTPRLDMVGDMTLRGSAPNGRQIQIADSSVIASIGTGYSSGALRLASNAVATLPGTDNWGQGYGASTSMLLEIDGAVGLKMFKAAVGATGAYTAFWGAPVFTISLAGSVTIGASGNLVLGYVGGTSGAVTAGAGNSGGAGFRMLVVPN